MEFGMNYEVVGREGVKGLFVYTTIMNQLGRGMPHDITVAQGRDPGVKWAPGTEEWGPGMKYRMGTGVGD